MLVKDILNIIKGDLISGNEQTDIEEYSIDTRTIKNNDMYVSIKGEKINGNFFIEEAIEKGAIGTIFQGEIDNSILEKYSNKIIIRVSNTIKAIQDLAKFKRAQYDIPVIAITGSVGKTSTKDIIASVLEQKYKVLKTEGNYNNHIGLPLTILKLKDHTAMCVEMGMNHFGEISILTSIAKPTIAVITNVGTAHIGILGSRDNILKAKLEILEGLQENGKIIINNDNDLLNRWNEKQNDYEVITYGIQENSTFTAENIIEQKESSTYDINIDNNCELIDVPVPGTHFIYNSLCAISIGKLLDIDIEKIRKGILNFQLSSKRMEIRKIKDNITLLVDCYNANFDSMKAGLEVLGKYENNRKIAVLGDMLELGKFANELHEKAGKEVLNNNIDVLVAIGKYAKRIAEQAVGIKEIYICDSNEHGTSALKQIMQENDVILFKASNAMKFMEIVEEIQKWKN